MRTTGPRTQRTVARRMTARYRSRCSNCTVRIEPGDEIYYNGVSSWHAGSCPTPVGVTSTGAVVEGRRVTPGVNCGICGGEVSLSDGHCPCQDEAGGIARSVTIGGRPTPRDPSFIQWVAELIMENGGIDGAWAKYGELSEFWDGEPDITYAASIEFFGAVPAAIRQNSLIHPGGWER